MMVSTLAVACIEFLMIYVSLGTSQVQALSLDEFYPFDTSYKVLQGYKDDYDFDHFDVPFRFYGKEHKLFTVSHAVN